MPNDKTQTVNPAGIFSEGQVSVKAAAKFIDQSVSKIYELMDEGQLPYVKIGRSRRIPKLALINLMAANLHNGRLEVTA